MRGAKAQRKKMKKPTSIFHISDSSLYNLVLDNTVIIVDKLVYHSDGTPSPIFCYINAYFGYKTSNVSNSLLTEENKNGVLAYVVYIYTMSMFFFTSLCMQVNLRKNDSFITLSRTVDSDSSVRKGRSDPYEWYASFSIGNTTAGGHDWAPLRFIAALVFEYEELQKQPRATQFLR